MCSNINSYNCTSRRKKSFTNSVMAGVGGALTVMCVKCPISDNVRLDTVNFLLLVLLPTVWRHIYEFHAWLRGIAGFYEISADNLPVTVRHLSMSSTCESLWSLDSCIHGWRQRTSECTPCHRQSPFLSVSWCLSLTKYTGRLLTAWLHVLYGQSSVSVLLLDSYTSLVFLFLSPVYINITSYITKQTACTTF